MKSDLGVNISSDLDPYGEWPAGARVVPPAGQLFRIKGAEGEIARQLQHKEQQAQEAQGPNLNGGKV